jgi:hypothetical protein
MSLTIFFTNIVFPEIADIIAEKIHLSYSDIKTGLMILLQEVKLIYTT